MSRSLEQCDIRRGVAPPGLTLETLIVPLVTQNTGRGHHPPSPLPLSHPTSAKNFHNKRKSQRWQGAAQNYPVVTSINIILKALYAIHLIVHTLPPQLWMESSVFQFKSIKVKPTFLFAAKPTQSRIMKGSAGKGGKKQFCWACV